jgi:hypothetical protein
VYAWANETCVGTALEPLREVFGDLMNFDTWLQRPGRRGSSRNWKPCDVTDTAMRAAAGTPNPHPRSPR